MTDTIRLRGELDLICVSEVYQALLIWNEPNLHGSPLVDYKLYRLIGNADPPLNVGSLLQTQLEIQYTDTPLDTNTVKNEGYSYRVTASNEVGASPPSNTVYIKAYPPDAPVLDLAQINGNQIDLTWNSPNPHGFAVTNYSVYRMDNSSPETTIQVANVSIPSYSDTDINLGFLASTGYTYYVLALNVVGSSESSNLAFVQG